MKPSISLAALSVKPWSGELLVGEALEHGAQIAGVGTALLVDDFAENQHFAGAEDVGGAPIEGRPIDPQAEIALFLGREAADRRAVEGQVVPALDQELLVIIEHVEAAFEIAEEHRHGFDALFVAQVFEALFLNLMDGNAVHSLFLGLQVHLL